MRLILTGTDSVHVRRFIGLVRPEVEAILWICDGKPQNPPVNVIPVDFSLKHPSAWWGTVHRIRKVIDDFQPDIIHMHQANSVAWYTLRAVKRQSVPTILTAWGSDILVLPNKHPLLRAMVKWCLRKSLAWTADSKDLLQAMLVLSGCEEKIKLLASFGIDLPNVKKKKERLIYSNRLHAPLYRIDDILQAFSRFRETAEGKQWKLVIAGNGPETKSLKTLANNLGLQESTLFTGWVDKSQNAEFYARARIYISIPTSDGTSASLLEAMSFGCIPIVSDLPSNREWIKEGENGHLVSDTLIDFISPALSLNEKKATMINSDLVSLHATPDVCRKRFLQLYHELCIH